MASEDNMLVNGIEIEEEAPQKPIISLRASQNAQELEMELIRPAGKVLKPEYDDIMQEIAGLKVTYGIDENIIKALCATPRYNVSMVVARGKKAKTGADGSVEYLIDMSTDLKPRINSDGTADYRDLGFTKNVQKGQILCNINLAQKGADGIDIYGNILPGTYGKEPKHVAGKNTGYSEDKTKLIALISGNAEVKAGVISVNEMLKVNGNVDNSTGDINFVGDVIISGDIVSGFRVTAGGNITVKGNVEGAWMHADGDIIVNAGVNGMERGSISAGGNIRCMYIQSCNIKAGGNIYADTIMYCHTECGGDMELKGKRGVLIGGSAAITGVLRVNTIGSSSHTATYVRMCNTDGLQKELAELQKHVKKLEAELLSLEQIVNRYNDLKSKGIKRPDLEASMSMVSSSSEGILRDKEETLRRIKEVEHRELEISSSGGSYIECKNRIHSGVSLSFGPLKMLVNSSFVFSRVSIADEEISISPLMGGQ